jgi:general secretion pathway protein J
MKSSTAGFTLLEVLAALVLLSLLLLGVYSGVRTATQSVRAGTASVERVDQLRSAQEFLRRELSQTLVQPIARNQRGEDLYFIGSAHEMRYVAPLPGYLGKLGPQLQQLRLVDDGHGQSRLELSLAILPPDGQPPKPLGDPQVLFDHIRSGSFTYSGIDLQGNPVAPSDHWDDGRFLPMLVDIDLHADGTHAWPRLSIPLRTNPAQAVMARMPTPNGGAR